MDAKNVAKKIMRNVRSVNVDNIFINSIITTFIGGLIIWLFITTQMYIESYKFDRWWNNRMEWYYNIMNDTTIKHIQKTINQNFKDLQDSVNSHRIIIDTTNNIP